MFQISIVNRTRTISDLELHRVVRAINRQLAEDFAPYWDFGGVLRVEGPARGAFDANSLLEMRGDAILYLLDSASSDDALGYHDRNMQGIPYGFVYLDLCAQLGDAWSATLSHEALELVADPQCNLLVKGPHPRDPSRPDVYHYFEMCDAVQAQVYEIDGVPVSNFVLPAYFSPNQSDGARKDFSGTTLRSFRVNPGGYIGFFDPAKDDGTPDTYFADEYSERRYMIKSGGVAPDAVQPHGRVTRRHGAGQEVRGVPTAKAAPAPARGMASNAPPGKPDPIRHVVVLMLENRSFDHVLGGLQGAIGGLDGVDRKNPGSNLDKGANVVIKQAPIALDKVSNTFSVHHEFADVHEQLAGGGAHFVDNYVKNNPTASAAERAQVMAYFEDGALPVVHALAKNYLVCNRWFSSLPGPTWPNRLFVHSGTCLGRVVMPSADDLKELDQLWGAYRQDTIYDRLDNARVDGDSIPWRIYHDGFPQSVILDNLKKPFLFGRYGDMDDFFSDAKDEATFPAYSFIEPRYVSVGGRLENDQHTPSGMAGGEALIASVYNAIRSNEALWRSTLLVITYDEHGGFYDHVTPPAAIPPDKSSSPFAFDTFGVRVPTILVSPYVDKGCDDALYDHTSILRYLVDKYGLAPLGERTVARTGDAREVGNFASQIRSVAREDTLPPFHPSATMRAAARAPAPALAPDNTQRIMLAFAERMRVYDQLTRRGAVLGSIATHLPEGTPSGADEFARRMEAVDAWIDARNGVSAPPPVPAMQPAAVDAPAARDAATPPPAARDAVAPPPASAPPKPPGHAGATPSGKRNKRKGAGPGPLQ